MNAIINVGTLAASLVPLAFLNRKIPDPNKQTQINLGIGTDGNSEGSVPHIAVWDGNGQRIAQYKGDEDGHLKAGGTTSYLLDNNQNGHKAAQPEYISIVMQENDAICLSAVAVMGNGAQWTWTGDMGYTCAAQ
jgi:hypothetical protein